MSVNYTTAIKNSRLEVVRTALQGGYVHMMTSADAPLVDVPFSTIAAPVNGVLTVIASPQAGTATAAGTAARASLRDAGDADVATGLTVGTSGADINLNDTALLVGSQVTLNSGTITSP